jgi:class 3 adenylate cyclase
MKEALDKLNVELEERWGVRLVNRTGVNTGEVVAGDVSSGQRLVTGDTVNTAARLEQAAPPLEVLIGEPTHRLVKDFVEV